MHSGEISQDINPAYHSLMNRTKFRKSLIKFNQNANQISQHLAYLPLIEFNKNRMSVNVEGLTAIEEQSNGKLFLVAVYSSKKAIINSIYRSSNLLQDEREESGIWVTNYPRYDYEKEHKFLFLHVSFGNPDDCLKIHAICSLICSAILIDTNSISNLSFLTGISSRIIYNKDEKNQLTNRNERKRELANLIFLKKSKNKESVSDLIRNSSEIDEVLTKFSIQAEVNEIYRSLVLLKLSNDALEFQNQAYLSRFQEELRNMVTSNTKNEDLRCGAILREYIEIITDSFERKGMVDIVGCANDIKISQGFNAYNRAVQFYHLNLKRQLRDEGIPHLREILRTAREDTIQQFKKFSNDATYLIKINEHMDQAQQKLLEQNNKLLDLKNLAYLKQSSQQLLSRIAREKLTQQQAQPYIEAIINDYKKQSYGDNKYQILTNYLNIIHATVAKNANQNGVNEANAVRKELDATRKERDELEERIERIRRENSKKCCEIM